MQPTREQGGHQDRSITPMSVVGNSSKALEQEVSEKEGGEVGRVAGEKRDLDQLIQNLKEDLELKYPHPRSPAKFIDKSEYLKALDPQAEKQIKNATITLKSMFKAKIHLTNFQK